MKKGLFSVVFASAMLGATTYAFAGAYGEAEQAEEIPPPAPAAVAAEEPPPPRIMRKFSGFLQDAETTHGLRVEIDSMYGIHYYDNAGDVEAVNTLAHISYGKDLFEVGVALPYIYAHQDSLAPNSSWDDLGDLTAWAKVLPVRTDRFRFGLGLITTFPTAEKHLDIDAFGFEPFLTAAVIFDPAEIRYHAGYFVTTDPDDPKLRNPSESDAFDYFDQNLGVLVPVHDMVVLRAEITHQHFVASDFDPVSIIPGADVTIAIGSNELIVRPTVGVGLCDAAPNWQAGLGLAFNVNGI